MTEEDYVQSGLAVEVFEEIEAVLRAEDRKSNTGASAPTQGLAKRAKRRR